MLRSKFIVAVFFVLSALFSMGCNGDVVRPTEARLMIGDAEDWRKSAWDDQSWKVANGTDYKGIFVIRFHFDLPQRTKGISPFGVKVISLGAYDAFWDGKKIGSSGTVGNSRKNEIAGFHSMVLPLPDSLSLPGKHVLALRISNFHYQRRYSFFNAQAGTYQNLIQFPILMAMLMAILAGAFFVGATYYFFLFSQHRSEKLYLVFSLLCTLFLCLLIAEYLPVFWNYPYPVQLIRLEVIGALSLSIAILIPYFLNRLFATFNPIKFNLLVIALLCTVFLWNHGRYDLTAQFMGLIMGLGSLFVSVAGVYKKAGGAWLVCLAIMLGAAASWFLYYDYSLYLGFGFLLLTMLYLLSERSKSIELAYRQTILLSERLKTELLKKSIQPHFIMNTLTALIELIERSPSLGTEMIIALSGEFEILSSMAEKSLVPVNTEIELCLHHLHIMRLRKEIDYRWETSGINPEEQLPPAILHTLLENGITHSRPLADGTVQFHLDFKETSSSRIYEFRTHAINRTTHTAIKKGTGLSYVEARLREVYAEAWLMSSGPDESGWRTKITIGK